MTSILDAATLEAIEHASQGDRAGPAGNRYTSTVVDADLRAAHVLLLQARDQMVLALAALRERTPNLAESARQVGQGSNRIGSALYYLRHSAQNADRSEMR